jgi:hypothetical protein
MCGPDDLEVMISKTGQSLEDRPVELDVASDHDARYVAD